MSLFSARPAPPPVDPPTTPLTVGGTVLWLAVAGVLWLNQDTLVETGRSWWLDCAWYGVGVGLMATTATVIHDRHKRRKRASAE
ncbi:MAG: DUF2530 domain-containing protein [Stackebrandtia sp.]